MENAQADLFNRKQEVRHVSYLAGFLSHDGTRLQPWNAGIKRERVQGTVRTFSIKRNQ